MGAHWFPGHASSAVLSTQSDEKGYVLVRRLAERIDPRRVKRRREKPDVCVSLEWFLTRSTNSTTPKVTLRPPYAFFSSRTPTFVISI